MFNMYVPLNKKQLQLSFCCWPSFSQIWFLMSNWIFRMSGKGFVFEAKTVFFWFCRKETHDY